MTAEPLPFTLTVTMLSDWHVGSGAGRHGAIDRLIDRDGDRLPYIPATTLRGMWRDAAERLALGLDRAEENGVVADRSKEPHSWSALLADLFGSQPAVDGERTGGKAPTPGRIALTDARLGTDLRKRLICGAPGGCPATERLVQALAFAKPGVAIGRRTGRALQDHLRFEEVARRDAVLEAKGTLRLSDGAGGEEARPAFEPDTLVAFLFAATRLVERLGGKRRRGGGRCQWKLSLTNGNGLAVRSVEDAITHLRDHTMPALPDNQLAGKASQPSAAADRKGETPAESDAIWEKVALRLDLQSPVAVAAATLGNVVTSLDHVPGTMLLAYVTRKLVAAGLPEADVRRAVAAGDVRALPATIEVEQARGLPATIEVEQARGLPAPFAWAREKTAGLGEEAGKPIWNLLVETRRDKGRSGEEAGQGDNKDKQLKPERKGYVPPQAPVPVPTKEPLPVPIKEPRTLVRTHNTVEDEVQRPTEAVGGVYSYEAIQAGETLRTEVWVRPGLAKRLTPGWQAKMEGEARLGRANKAGYGRAAVEVVAHWAETGGGAEPSADGLLFVWLASDALLRGTGLSAGTTVEALCRAVEETINQGAPAGSPVRLSLVDKPKSGDGEARTEAKGELRAEIRARRLDSWLAGWNLPRPSLVALQAGSCAVFKAEGRAITQADIARLEAQGIGERRAEGFGHLLVNRPQLTGKTWVTAKREERARCQGHADEPPLPPDGFAAAVERAAWEAAIRDAAMALAASEKGRKQHLGWTIARHKDGGLKETPPMSQLGALRSVMGRFEGEAEREAVRRWLDKLEANPERKKKWGENGAAARALRNLVEPADTGQASGRIWDILELKEQPRTLVRGPAIRRDLWPFAVRTLLLAAMLEHKRDLERKRKEMREGRRQTGSQNETAAEEAG